MASNALTNTAFYVPAPKFEASERERLILDHLSHVRWIAMRIHEKIGGAVGLAIVGAAVLRLGLGPGQVPVGVVAVVVSVLFARALFEAGVLFGGADAKGVMVAGLMVPFFPTPVLAVPAAVGPVTSVLPFAVDLLVDAALLSVAAPLALAFLNLSVANSNSKTGSRPTPSRYLSCPTDGCGFGTRTSPWTACRRMRSKPRRRTGNGAKRSRSSSRNAGCPGSGSVPSCRSSSSCSSGPSPPLLSGT